MKLFQTDLEDGPYRVAYGGMCAGFVVEGGGRCAPVLCRNTSYWVQVVVRVFR